MKKLLDFEICYNYLDKGLDIPIGSLVNYILEEFPDSCFTHNWGSNNDLRLDDNLIIVNAYNVFRYEVLKWCGCGTPEVADELVRNFLRINVSDNLNNRHSQMESLFGTSNIYDNTLLLCFAYTMDAAGLTEHGSGIGGAWTSDRGKIYLWILDKMNEIGGYDIEG